MKRQLRRIRWPALALMLAAGWQLQQGLQVQPAPAAVHAPQQALPAPPQPDGAQASFVSLAPLGLQPGAPGDASAPGWEQRLSDARSEQLRLQAQAGLSAAQRAAAMQAHLQQHFSGAERPQVEALLRLMPH